MRYLLDTHALVWLISHEEARLPESLRDSIKYYEDEFAISEISLVEIIQLQQIGRLEANRPDKIRSVVEANGIAILHIAPDIMETFYDLPMPDIAGRTHSDPFDRIIIATALRRGYTLVSHDTKFPWYKEHCRLPIFEV